MDNPKEDDLKRRLAIMLKPFPDAMEFLGLYNAYVHSIDDLVDSEEYRSDFENVLRTAHLASACFSSNFWRGYAHVLLPIEQAANNTYGDSVKFERSGEEWKEKAADTLRHSGIEVYLKVFELCCGREALREMSSDIREHTFVTHHDTEHKPI